MHKIVLPERILEKDNAEKEILEIFENSPQERISERTQIVGVPVPQIAKETLGVARLAPRERMQQRTVDAPTPQVLEETVEVGRLVSHERVQQRAAGQIEDLPQHPKETVEMARSVSHERLHQRAAEHIEYAPQFPAEVVEAVEVTRVTGTKSQDLWLRTLKQFPDETRHESLHDSGRGVVSREFLGLATAGRRSPLLMAVSTDFFKPQTV